MRTIFVLVLIFRSGAEMEYGRYATARECMREAQQIVMRDARVLNAWCEAQ